MLCWFQKLTYRNNNPNKLHVVDLDIPQLAPRLAVREYFLPKEGAVVIRKNGTKHEVGENDKICPSEFFFLQVDLFSHIRKYEIP